jgi:predicted phosphodiesterase
MLHHVDRCLVIPDVHQDIDWVRRVLKREPACDLVVFLGDYFDSYQPPRLGADVAETCAFMEAQRRALGRRVVFVLGNHDIQYLEAKPACDAHRTPRHLNYQCGAAYNHTTAKQVAKGLSLEFWHGARLFVSVNGWLLSHAGVALRHWPQCATPAASIAALDEAALKALRFMKEGSNPLLRAGLVRGGDAPVGGITWQDWDAEFSDDLPCPQIVGHTACAHLARQKGRSWCIDGRQTTYGVLTAEGLRVEEC